MRILFLSRWFPHPADNGSKLRILNLLQGLGEDHRVGLLSFTERSDWEQSLGYISRFCERVEAVSWTGARSSAGLGLFDPTPRYYRQTFSAEMRDAVLHALEREAIDLIIASQIDMAAYSPYFNDSPALFEEAEVGVLYEQFAETRSPVKKARFALTWFKHRRFLEGLLRNFQACTVASEQERRLLYNAVDFQKPVEVVPNSIDLNRYNGVTAARAQRTLIYTGSFTYTPNYQAVRWFLETIYPPLKAEFPELRLVVTGEHAGLPLPPAEDVEVTGYVEDIRPLVAGATVSLAPILTGGGTRLKILEAMALGTPVVSTTKGAEGIAARDGQHILLADTPEGFQAQVRRLLVDSTLRETLARNARNLITEFYAREVIVPRFVKLAEQLAAEPIS